MWDKIYDTYVKDDMNLSVREFFERENPAALQEMTAIMMETTRKGYWKATEEQLQTIAALHSETVDKFNAGCNGFTCDYARLIGFISSNLPADKTVNYNSKINDTRQVNASFTADDKNNGVVLE